MRTAEVLVLGAGTLRSAGVGSPRHDAEALLAHLLEVPLTQVSLVEELSAARRGRYWDLVARRAAREPLQHITGRAAFRYLEVEVGPGVFIPRPETECLAGWLIGQLHQPAAAETVPVVVDLCAGSGAMAMSIATEAPGVEVHAVEISEPAHRYAARNLAGTDVQLHLGDIADTLHEYDGRVDAVVANPPYIPLGAYESVDAEVREFDPPSALWAGDEGLDMIRVVERVGARLLRPGGVLGCEHADVQGEAVVTLFARSGAWADVRDHSDLAGRPRYVTARRAGRMPDERVGRSAGVPPGTMSP